MTKVKVERVYLDAGGTPTDGYRVFVDRLWPRGESKEKFHYDLWAKEIAPSNELRRWFHEDPASRWESFKNKYKEELEENPSTADFVAELKRHDVVTLLFGAKDTEHNNADVLADYLCSIAGFTR